MKVLHKSIKKITRIIPIIILISTVWMQPQLLRPVATDTLNYLEICFQWTQSSAAAEYQLQISEVIELEKRQPAITTLKQSKDATRQQNPLRDRKRKINQPKY